MTWFYDLADRVLVPTEVYRRELVDTGIPAEKIEILERGVDTSLFHAARRDPGFYERTDDASLGGSLLRVLYVGRLAPEKNLGFLLRELRPLLDSRADVELVLVGDGPSRQELARQAGDRVRFLGELHGETLATAYASADLFVFPSTTDTFGNVVLEAQACGLPVVVTSEGGPRELVIPGPHGPRGRHRARGRFRRLGRAVARRSGAATGDGPSRSGSRAQPHLELGARPALVRPGRATDRTCARVVSTRRRPDRCWSVTTGDVRWLKEPPAADHGLLSGSIVRALPTAARGGRSQQVRHPFVVGPVTRPSLGVWSDSGSP